MVINLEKLADENFKKKNFVDAEDLYKRIIAINPHHAIALYRLGHINIGKGDYKTAEMVLDASLKLRPNIDTLKLLAYVKEKNNNLYDALIMYEQALALESTEELFIIIGNLYIQLELYENAINIAKDYVEKFPNLLSYRRLFLLYLNLSKTEELKELCDEIQELFPNKGLMFNLIGMYKEFLEHDYLTAQIYYEKAVKLGVPTAAYDLAQCFRRVGKYDEAEKYCKKILDTYPNKNDVLNLMTDLYLIQKKMRKGYKYFLSRDLGDATKNLKNKWDGKDYPDKKILVIADINTSNVIRNIRFLDVLREKFKDVIVAISTDLQTFFENNNIKTILYSEVFDAEYDKYVMLSELQYYLNIGFENIPYSKGYLKTDKIDLADGNYKVGLFWKAPGDSMNAVNEQSIDITKYLSGLFELDNISYYSLQKGDIFNTLEKFPQIKDLSEKLNTVEDYAKYISSMDLVIAINSNVLHLAGSMSIPAIAILPENASWYWFNCEQKTEWYSSVELVRQDKGCDWSSISAAVIERVKKHNDKYKKIK